MANNFSIVAFVASTPVSNTLSNGATVRRFAISVRRSENDKTTSALINCECWRKADFAQSLEVIEKGKLLQLSGFFKPEEWESNGRMHNRVVLAVTAVQEFVKQDAPADNQQAVAEAPAIEQKKTTRRRKTA